MPKMLIQARLLLVQVIKLVKTRMLQKVVVENVCIDQRESQDISKKCNYSDLKENKTSDKLLV